MNNLSRSRVIKLGNEEYEVIPSEAVAASKIIADMWLKLGRPTDPFTQSGKKMMDIIIAVWMDLYPLQVHDWLKERQDYQNNEMTITEQVHKRTGRSLASYPLPVYSMMKKVFKGFDPAERKNCLRMVKYWPIFRFANKA